MFFFVAFFLPPSFQMEILEMLAMSGADLENKNKNDETPSGKYNILYLYSMHSVHFIATILIITLIT